MKRKIEDTLEEVLRLIVAVAEKNIGHMTTHLGASLTEMLLQEQLDIEFSGGCGKRRLACQFRGKLLVTRLALSPEAIAGGCLSEVERWQQEVKVEVEKLDLDHPVKIAIVEDRGNSLNPLSIISTNNQGPRAGG